MIIDPGVAKQILDNANLENKDWRMEISLANLDSSSSLIDAE